MKKGLTKLILAFFAFVFTIASANAQQAKIFPDVSSNHWAASQIKELSENNIIVGYPDGMFRPDNNVTRAEFASMAIKALKQEHTTVAQPVNFVDIKTDYWAYDMIQRALYFDLISCPSEDAFFRPNDSVSHGEAIAVIVNALTTEAISPIKAKDVLKKYVDVDLISPAYLIAAGKAEILGMNVHIPNTSFEINANTPATRAEIAVLLKNMIEQAKLNPNKKLADAMRKKIGEGYVIPQAFVQGSIGTIPAGAIVPIQLGAAISSQTSNCGEVYLAKAPQNYVTKEKFILISQGSDLKGRLIDVRPGKLFVRNGVLVLLNENITTSNNQNIAMKATGEISKQKNWFIKFLRAVFKGEMLDVAPQGTVYVKLLQPLKVDLTNGWVIE